MMSIIYTIIIVILNIWLTFLLSAEAKVNKMLYVCLVWDDDDPFDGDWQNNLHQWSVCVTIICYHYVATVH